jgi:putative transposase
LAAAAVVATSASARAWTSARVWWASGNRDEFGVEPICTVLRSAGVSVAPSTYYAVKTRALSARACRDAILAPVLKQLWEDNYRVYGARKLWKAARRAGHDIGRDQVARLMRAAGIAGARRGKRVRTTKPDLGAPWHPDLVGRDFTATAPNQLWVTDLTFVPTWAGVAYVCFLTDAFSRMIVGWRVAGHMRTSMVLDAIEMARSSRGKMLAGPGEHVHKRRPGLPVVAEVEENAMAFTDPKETLFDGGVV